jgi:hypothetical protein
MDDNIWEYPFGELDDDEDYYYREPESDEITHNKSQIRNISKSSLFIRAALDIIS